MWVACAAVFISVCALFVSVAEMRIMRELQADERRHQRASVWPQLAYSVGTVDGVWTFGVLNNGIGPAVIETMEVTVGDAIVYSWPEAVEAMFGDSSRLGQHTHLFAGVVVPAGEHYELMKFTVPDGKTDPEPKELKVEICYCSVFDECWRLDDVLSRANPVEVCEPADERQFVIGKEHL